MKDFCSFGYIVTIIKDVTCNKHSIKELFITNVNLNVE